MWGRVGGGKGDILDAGGISGWWRWVPFGQLENLLFGCLKEDEILVSVANGTQKFVGNSDLVVRRQLTNISMMGSTRKINRLLNLVILTVSQTVDVPVSYKMEEPKKREASYQNF